MFLSPLLDSIFQVTTWQISSLWASRLTLGFVTPTCLGAPRKVRYDLFLVMDHRPSSVSDISINRLCMANSLLSSKCKNVIMNVEIGNKKRLKWLQIITNTSPRWRKWNLFLHSWLYLWREFSIQSSRFIFGLPVNGPLHGVTAVMSPSHYQNGLTRCVFMSRLLANGTK